MKEKMFRLLRIIGWLINNPRKALRGLEHTIFTDKALHFASAQTANNDNSRAVVEKQIVITNPLRDYFDEYKVGAGIWKWNHYFDIYHKHFEKFRDKEVHVVEVGVYSGGSLEMWRKYFGPRCFVYGVDIQPECKLYEKEGIRIFIGDQSDREFWRRFKEEVPQIDILIDDGGHQPKQQIITFEETLHAISPGGIYLCEDVHGSWNYFADYVSGLQKSLIHQSFTEDKTLTSQANGFQANIHSIHSYPFVFVIEKHLVNRGLFSAPKHGTKWEPFL